MVPPGGRLVPATRHDHLNRHDHPNHRSRSDRPDPHAPRHRPHRRPRHRGVRRSFPRSLSTVALIALGLAVGCTFERRPQTQVNADPGQIQAPVPEEPASSFLEGLQAARLSGREGELRDMLHPDVTVMWEGRILPLDRDGEEDGDEVPGSAWALLDRSALPGGAGGISPTVTDSAVFEGGAFFVVDYEADTETFFLARDSAGWTLRLLHRATGDGGSP